MSLETVPSAPQPRPKCFPACTWTGRGCLPRLPWATPFHGNIVVISLFDDIGGLLLALLALNVRFYYVAVECDEGATACLKANASEILCFKDVTTFSFRNITARLKEIKFDAILVAGGSPCQGNSLLNPSTRNQRPRIPVACLLENVPGHLDFFKAASDVFCCTPIITETADFSWVRRRRAWWVLRATKWCCESLRVPKSCVAEWRQTTFAGAIRALRCRSSFSWRTSSLSTPQ
jgi:hypothetical protein